MLLAAAALPALLPTLGVYFYMHWGRTWYCPRPGITDTWLVYPHLDLCTSLSLGFARDCRTCTVAALIAAVLWRVIYIRSPIRSFIH
jgi:hypothetical protein